MMETIRVNMTPCEDVQTIHASQNDNEAREWGFELHNNGDKIDSSSITDQLVFKAYKGGTEQILPENGSTPTTSPFKGDIKYPQGLLSDQEFLYRESPTEEDGLAKITDIKGNTLNWNQLIKNGNFADGLTNWEQASATLSVSNGVCRATFTGIAWNNDIRQSVAIKSGHRYLIVCDYLMSAEFGDLVFTAIFGQSGFSVPIRNQRVKSHLASIFTSTGNITSVRFATVSSMESYSGQYYEVSNVNLFDLTQMGLDISSPSEFTSLFSLPYYAYNQGSLLSFMGNGIKTVGANILDLSSEFDRVGVSYTVDEDGWFTVTDISYPSLYRNRFMLPLALTNGSALIEIDTSKTASTNFRMVLYNDTIRVAKTTTKLENKAFDRISFDWSTAGSTTFRVMVTTLPTIGTYEPYTSSTLSLPISTYFPNGMKSAGSVYDELTESKAITRIGSVDLGSLTWEYRTTGSVYAPYFYAAFTGIKPNGNPNVRKANILCSKYSTAHRSQESFIDKTICADGSSTELTQLQIKDSSFTDATVFKNSLQGQYLYYEMVTETETSFTTASLVTENAEIPLSNEDGTLIGKCIEQLSSESGFFDAKIKLADEDGECYSNKFQLHVERSPQ